MNAIITGASKGIGRAIAESFAREHINLAICARGEETLNETREALLAINPEIEVLSLSADMSLKTGIKEFADFVKRTWNEVHILVNNAGGFLPGSILDEDEGNLVKLMEINLYSAYYLTREIISFMPKHSGSYIFNMSSIAALVAYSNGASYGISKGALLSFSRCLREELKSEGVRVSAIMPGATLTDTWGETGLPDERFMKPEDVALAVTSAVKMSDRTVLEEIILRPQLGDI